MANASAIEIKAALKKSAAWGTAMALGAGDGLMLLPHSIKMSRDSHVDDSMGRAFAAEVDAAEVKVEGDMPAYLRYDGLDLPLALAMGATAGAPVQQGATAAYAQSITLSENTDGLFGCLALENTVNIDEFPSLKLSGFTIKGEVGKPLEITMHAIADDRATGSATNTQATFANVTYFETASRVLMSQGVMRINDRDSGALGPGDEIYPSSFELTFKRKLRGIYAIGSAGNTIDEPTGEGQPEIKLKLEFPRYTTKAYFEDWDAGTPKKLDLTFTGAEIEAPYSREFKLQGPSLRLASVELPLEKGILKHPLEFLCLECESAPTGMSGITMPFQIDLINRQSVDVLA